MNNTRIAYTSTSITPEQARDARARAWGYVFSCWYAKQKDMPPQETTQMTAQQRR